MAYIAVHIASAILAASWLLIGDRDSTAASRPDPGVENHGAIYTAYWPFIGRPPIPEAISRESPAGLQDTGATSPNSAGIDTLTGFALERTSTAIDAAARIAREVNVQGKFLLPIIQQPADQSGYVSTEPGMITQFGMAARNGVTGLLAHNYLSGALFYQLDVGQEIDVLYANQQLGHYRVSQILSFQKLQPAEINSDYLDLQTGKVLSTLDVFRKVYRGEHHLTLQTCLERNGNLGWGLYFVIAVPVSRPSGYPERLMIYTSYPRHLAASAPFPR